MSPIILYFVLYVSFYNRIRGIIWVSDFPISTFLLLIFIALKCCWITWTTFWHFLIDLSWGDRNMTNGIYYLFLYILLPIMQLCIWHIGIQSKYDYRNSFRSMMEDSFLFRVKFPTFSLNLLYWNCCPTFKNYSQEEKSYNLNYLVAFQ